MDYRKPQKTFEKSGSVDPVVSYYVPLEKVTNVDRQNMKTMVDMGRYFSIFAPRQSGKTTFFRDFCRNLEKENTYICILLSFQDFKPLSKEEFYSQIQKEVHKQLLERLEKVQCQNLEKIRELLHQHQLHNHISFRELFEKLNNNIPPKRIVVIIDEFDGIPQEELENFLSSIRELFQKYKEQKNKALFSIGLVGIRNITKLVVGGVSPFNIADEVSLPPFSLKNIHDLYGQYTEETNQTFTQEAVEMIYEKTAGQPWLVNRLASIVTNHIRPETIAPITKEDVGKGINYLLKERNSHFDNLLEKVKPYGKTFLTILSNGVNYNPDNEDQTWLEQYGIIKKVEGKSRVSNAIYKKRFLTLFSADKETLLPRQIFISYSREDKKWVEMLIGHLGALEYAGIRYWFDEKIRTGDIWSPEIQKAIENSHLAVCLISKRFLNSEFIREKEIPAILKNREKGMAIFPILLEPCAWEPVPWLAEIQINPRDGVPLSKINPEEREEKLISVVKEIREIFDTLSH